MELKYYINKYTVRVILAGNINIFKLQVDFLKLCIQPDITHTLSNTYALNCIPDFLVFLAVFTELLDTGKKNMNF